MLLKCFAPSSDYLPARHRPCTLNLAVGRCRGRDMQARKGIPNSGLITVGTIPPSWLTLPRLEWTCRPT